MDTALTVIILLLRCWTVSSSPSSPQSISFSMDFSAGTRLLVDAGEEMADCDDDGDLLRRRNKTGSSNGPSVQILSSVRLSQDPGSPHLLVCLLTGLNSPRQHVLWWLDDTPVTSAGTEGPWMKSEGGYSATSVWEVPAADWRPTSSYWCGTIQEGRVHRQKLCSQD